ncbi:hypothetical protein OIDMADRAFT_26023 [Oidiodendron maius Zn]|uniref:Zn(2)-C6 fungal-type domain-containing protein n=1 Tax=Oidiodendron maius (strain Zn) TaxID=913774 RepID=A0A0C3CWE3_OIDMZ|nr:hypothetical protein OIDMADRAFT_26023 [Oidiodendron maius Zn]
MAQLSARYVCQNCKRRKKRCDKALPKCTQCKELEAECAYQINPDTSAGEIQQIQFRLMRLETLLLPQLREFNFSDNNSIESSQSQKSHQSQQSQVSQPPSPSSSMRSEATLNGVQQLLTAVANSVFRSDNAQMTEDDILEAYFNHIDKWLPILSEKRLYKKFARDRLVNRPPETDLLLMCMYLLVKDPSSLDSREDMHENYKNLRTIFFMLQAKSADLLELAQSGLMLATYEHVSGHIEQAYSTIWACVRMLHSLRLEDKFRISMDDNYDKQTECAEAHALWWATLIRDRFINLEDQMRDRPIASRHPNLDDYTPVNVSAWESSSVITPLLKRRLSDRSSGQLSPDSFEREAKACYHLSQILDWRSQGVVSTHVRTIAAPIEDFLSRLMDPSTGTRGTFCGATSMAITSIYELFSSYNPNDDILVARSQLYLSQDAKLVLSTMTRIVIDIANTFNETFDSFNIATISPSYSYLMYRAGMHVLLTADTSCKKTLQDFYALRRCCWYFSQRWLVASTYLETLEKSAGALEMSLPYLGQPVKLNNGQPGL